MVFRNMASDEFGYRSMNSERVRKGAPLLELLVDIEAVAPSLSRGRRFSFISVFRSR